MKKFNAVKAVKAAHRELTLGLNLKTKVVKDKTKYSRKTKHKGWE